MAINIYIYIIYYCSHIFTSMWNYLLRHVIKDLLMWDLTRGICTRGAEDVCAGTQ
jgi:hypothetical protein